MSVVHQFVPAPTEGRFVAAKAPLLLAELNSGKVSPSANGSLPGTSMTFNVPPLARVLMPTTRSLLGMLPHAIHELGSVHQSAAWLLGGFLIMLLLQRFLPFHHHDVAEGSPLEPCGHTHSLAERSARSLSWMGVALGLSLHSIFDGLAMAAAVASGEQGHGGALGLGTALASSCTNLSVRSPSRP